MKGSLRNQLARYHSYFQPNHSTHVFIEGISNEQEIYAPL
jgi:hypothetical protein